MERILIINDEPASERGLRHSFESAGFLVDVASEERTALELFRATRPRIVILDLCTAGSVGRDLCRRLKQELPASAFIVLSASNDIQDKVLMLESGAEDYMTKPLSPRELLARVRAALRRVDHASQSSALAHSPMAAPR